MLAASWKEVAYALDLPDHLVTNIQYDTRQLGCEVSCHQAFSRWLGGEGCEPVCWETLILALRDAEQGELAVQLQDYFDNSFLLSYEMI